MQILHRLQPLRPVRQPVDVTWFNARCDQINKLMAGLMLGQEHLRFWKHKDLFEYEQLCEALSVFLKLSSIYVFSYFPFGFEGRIWDLIVSVPDHCLSFYFEG